MADELQTQYNGVGFVVRQAFSGIEGSFGLGFVLGTNLTLDVQTAIGSRVARNTAYSLAYTDPTDGQLKTISILHDPSIPFQAKLPENRLITFFLPASVLYKELTLTLTIAPNTAPVLRPRFEFNNAYARCSIRYYS